MVSDCTEVVADVLDGVEATVASQERVRVRTQMLDWVRVRGR